MMSKRQVSTSQLSTENTLQAQTSRISKKHLDVLGQADGLSAWLHQATGVPGEDGM